MYKILKILQFTCMSFNLEYIMFHSCSVQVSRPYANTNHEAKEIHQVYVKLSMPFLFQPITLTGCQTDILYSSNDRRDAKKD